MRWIGFLVFVTCWLLSASAHAAALPFDPDEATRAWLATMGPEAIARSNSYFEGGYWLDLADSALTIVIALLLMVLGFAKGVRAWLERTVKFYFLVTFGMAIFYILVSGVLTFPFAYYVGFLREHEFGLATQTFSEWFTEYLIGFGLNLIIGALFIAVLYLIIRAAKSAWWIWGAGVSIAFLMAVSMLAPVYISPIFNDYVAMQGGALKTDILHMAQANGVPADDVFVFDVSRQSNRVTANVSGFADTTRISSRTR